MSPFQILRNFFKCILCPIKQYGMWRLNKSYSNVFLKNTLCNFSRPYFVNFLLISFGGIIFTSAFLQLEYDPAVVYVVRRKYLLCTAEIFK